MDIKPISEQLSLSEQLQLSDVKTLAEQGYIYRSCREKSATMMWRRFHKPCMNCPSPHLRFVAREPVLQRSGR